MTSILIHPEELSHTWIDRMAQGGIDILGIHPEGGKDAAVSLLRLLDLQEDPQYRALIDYAHKKGLQVCYELHAMSFLLDRGLFAEHPEYFRMDESGNRVADKNFCPSCPKALALVAENAERLASRLYGSMDRYGFWLDDVRNGKCHCPKCRKLSASDQQLLAFNAMANRLRQSYPHAQIAYLAYFDTLELPEQTQPADGVFLEFAPMDKWNRLYGNAPRFIEGAARERKQMALLPKLFPKETATVLEYWIDNSLFSQWKKPPKALTPPDGAAIARDIAAYQKAGYRNFSVFGCFLGADYEALYGQPELSGLTDALQNSENRTF